MIMTAKLLREASDDFERRAKELRDRNMQAELIDLSTTWRFLAGEIDRPRAPTEEMELV